MQGQGQGQGLTSLRMSHTHTSTLETSQPFFFISINAISIRQVSLRLASLKPPPYKHLKARNGYINIKGRWRLRSIHWQRTLLRMKTADVILSKKRL